MVMSRAMHIGNVSPNGDGELGIVSGERFSLGGWQHSTRGVALCTR